MRLTCIVETMSDGTLISTLLMVLLHLEDRFDPRHAFQLMHPRYFARAFLGLPKYQKNAGRTVD